MDQAGGNPCAACAVMTPGNVCHMGVRIGNHHIPVAIGFVERDVYDQIAMAQVIPSRRIGVSLLGATMALSLGVARLSRWFSAAGLFLSRATVGCGESIPESPRYRPRLQATVGRGQIHSSTWMLSSPSYPSA